MEKEQQKTLDQLESRMDAVIEKLEELPVTSPEYDELLSELRQLTISAAMTAKKSKNTGGIEEYSTSRR